MVGCIRIPYLGGTTCGTHLRSFFSSFHLGGITGSSEMKNKLKRKQKRDQNTGIGTGTGPDEQMTSA